MPQPPLPRAWGALKLKNNEGGVGGKGGAHRGMPLGSRRGDGQRYLPLSCRCRSSWMTSAMTSSGTCGHGDGGVSPLGTPPREGGRPGVHRDSPRRGRS